MSIPTAELAETFSAERNLRWNLVGDGLRWQIWGVSLMSGGTILLLFCGLMAIGGTLKTPTALNVLMTASIASTAIGLLALLPGHVLTAFAPERPLTTALSLIALLVLAYGMGQVSTFAMLYSRQQIEYGHAPGQSPLAMMSANGGFAWIGTSFVYGVTGIGALLSLATALHNVEIVRRCSSLLFLQVALPILQLALTFVTSAFPSFNPTTSSIITLFGMISMTLIYGFAYLRATLPLLDAIRGTYPPARKPIPPRFKPEPRPAEPLPDPFAD